MLQKFVQCMKQSSMMSIYRYLLDWEGVPPDGEKWFTYQILQKASSRFPRKFAQTSIKETSIEINTVDLRALITGPLLSQALMLLPGLYTHNLPYLVSSYF